MKAHKLAVMAVFVMGIPVVSQAQSAAPTFAEEIAFLKKHVRVIVLADGSGQRQVALVPEYQGRVMTSSAAGGSGISFGWINRELIASGKKQPHINVYGGEDRFWLGPEGGQYAIFFQKGDPFDLDHWFTPAWIDTEAYRLIGQSKDQASFGTRFQLKNYSGTSFDLEVTRKVRLLDDEAIQKELGIGLAPGVKAVAFETVNQIKNAGKEAWKKEGGLLSIWILGMFNASQATTVAIPFVKGDEQVLGQIVNDRYFGKVPNDRLAVRENVLFFAADANCRSKIGIAPRRARPVLGSYDAQNGVLTIVQFTLPADSGGYVNSMWELQKDPYAGDAVNSYNDGPPAPGKPQLGKFYELETSSPALALAPGQTGTHVHCTFHFQGPEASLDPISVKVLGVSIAEIKTGLSRK